MKNTTLFLLAFAITIPCTGFSADDKALRKERNEAQKQRQVLKSERNKAIQAASREFREFSRELKKEYRERSSDLDTEFRLQQVGLQADRNTEIAIAESDMQQKMTSLLFNLQSANQDTLAQVKDDILNHAQAIFEIRKRSAQLEQDQKMENELAKHQLMSEGDQMALDKAEELGLRQEFNPILAKVIGDGLTKQEEGWNEREIKEVKKLYDTNQRLLREYIYGARLREWEMANKQEDFKLLWQKKSEMQEVNTQQTLYNSLLFQSTDNTEVNQQEISKRMAEYSKQIRLINIKHKQFSDENRIRRKQQRKKIMGR